MALGELEECQDDPWGPVVPGDDGHEVAVEDLEDAAYALDLVHAEGDLDGDEDDLVDDLEDDLVDGLVDDFEDDLVDDFEDDLEGEEDDLEAFVDELDESVDDLDLENEAVLGLPCA